jgi:hypothetical protein
MNILIATNIIGYEDICIDITYVERHTICMSMCVCMCIYVLTN